MTTKAPQGAEERFNERLLREDGELEHQVESLRRLARRGYGSALYGRLAAWEAVALAAVVVAEGWLPLRRLVVAGLAVLLAGCSSAPVPVPMTQQLGEAIFGGFVRDYDECGGPPNGRAMAPPGAYGIVFLHCMEARGWTLAPDEAARPIPSTVPR